MASVSQHRTPWTQSWRRTVLPLLAISASFLSSAAAEPQNIPAFAATTLAIPQAAPTDPANTVTLLRDDRIPVLQDGQWSFLQQDEVDKMRKRDESDIAQTTTAETTKTRRVVTVTDTGTTTGTTGTKSKTTAASPLPSILDSSLASNFSSGTQCPTFIKKFLADPTFKTCYPFSMLLQTSRSFFKAEKSLVAITQVLDATCAANATFCTGYLKDLAANLTSSANCGADYKLGNSVVVQAYMGMMAYQPLYTASCLKDSDSSAYCFADAITNLSTPANAYAYFLPLNITFPGSSRPTCNQCLQQTMAIYRSTTADRSTSIASTYLSAAQQVDVFCGSGFANDTLAEADLSSSAASHKRGPSLNWLLPTILLSVAAQLLL